MQILHFVQDDTAKSDGGNANLPIGGFKSTIQENGDPRDDSEKPTAMAKGKCCGGRSTCATDSYKRQLPDGLVEGC
jgi:hypothetical protein